MLPDGSGPSSEAKAIVTLSVGGTKIGAGAVNAAGEIIVSIPPIPTPSQSEALFEAMIAQIVEVAAAVGVEGQGVEVDGDEVLIRALRTSIAEDLTALGSDDYDTSHVVLSKLGYEREFPAFIPR